MLNEFANDIDIKTLYFNEIGKTKVLTKEELIELVKKAQAGDKKAYQLVTISNLKLVVSIAKKYSNFKLEYLDILQIGCLGLMKAISLFDVNKGYAFSTYASYWISSYIKREILNNNNHIRVPIHIQEKQIVLFKLINSLKIKLEREPTFEEILSFSNLNEKELKKLLQVYKTISYNQSINLENDKNEDMPFYIKTEYILEDEIIENLKKIEVNNLLDANILTEEENEIIKLRYGFYEEVLTVREVAKRLGISKSAVNYIEKKALDKLRINEKTKSLAIYRDNPEKALEYLVNYKKISKVKL